MSNNQLAIVDIDGVIANNTERFERATVRGFGDNNKIDWKIAFDPELVYLDEPIGGAREDLITLSEQGFQIVLLTSRPETMRHATAAWLDEYGFNEHTHLVMKPPAAQYVKTTVWKALTIDTLAMFLNASIVLFIDDEQNNIDEVSKHLDSTRYHLNTYTNLEAACKSVEGK